MHTVVTRFALSAIVCLGLVGCGEKKKAPAAKSPAAKAPTAKKATDKPGADTPAAVKKDKGDTPAGPVPANARVFFVEPKDGATVTGLAKDGLVAVKVKMGLEGMELRAAGKIVPGTGHHHILVDTELTKVGMPVKKDAQHIHFGKGQSEAEIFLKPGKHELSLQFANGAHLSYGPQLSASIGLTVSAAPAPATGDKPASAGAAPPADPMVPPETPPEPDPNLKK